MIVNIPDDIYHYENKLFGNFTKRQAVCGFLAILVMAPTYLFVYITLHESSLSMILSLLLGLPVMLCSKRNKATGQPMEVVIWYRLRSRFKWSQRRPYRMKNLYETIDERAKEYQALDEENHANEEKEQADANAKSKRKK